MAKEPQSPYLTSPRRLADVISAIQAMATYKRYKLEFKEWAKRISGNESKAEYWRKIFIDHPEFFRLNNDDKKSSLVWRRNKQRTYHVDLDKELTRAEVEKLSEDEKDNRLSRVPLSGAEITTLVSTAIDLHSRALEDKREQRWWYTPAIGIAGSLLGVLLGFILTWLL